MLVFMKFQPEAVQIYVSCWVCENFPPAAKSKVNVPRYHEICVTSEL